MLRKILSDTRFLFLLFLTLLLFQRYTVLKDFAWIYTDADQVIYIQAAQDYAKGIFYEPYFYGQKYNWMVEAFLAVPLIWLSIPPTVALPLVTAFIAIFPYLLLALCCYRFGKPVHALLVFFVALAMPVEYDMLTSMPRGFVNGVFLASIGAVPVLFRESRFTFLLYGFATLLGIIANQGSILLSLPIGIYLLLRNYKHRAFYGFVILGIILAIPILLTFQYFYTQHPTYAFHAMATFDYKWWRIGYGFGKLDELFKYVTPFFYGMGWPLYLIFGALSIYFYRSNKAASFALIVLLIFLTLFLGLWKAHDGYPGVFFSSARMFTALPVVIACFCVLLPGSLQQLKPALLLTAACLFLLRNNYSADIIRNASQEGNKEVVRQGKILDYTSDCEQLKVAAKTYGVSLVVFLCHDLKDLYNYACPALSKDFPVTLRPLYERRTWLLQRADTTVHRNILFVDYCDLQKEKLEKYDGEINTLDQGKGWLLLRNNKYSTMRMFDSLGIVYRKF